jgi:hypothetical protein
LSGPGMDPTKLASSPREFEDCVLVAHGYDQRVIAGILDDRVGMLRVPPAPGRTEKIADTSGIQDVDGRPGVQQSGVGRGNLHGSEAKMSGGPAEMAFWF